jgi:hypothetical protein
MKYIVNSAAIYFSLQDTLLQLKIIPICTRIMKKRFNVNNNEKL